MILKFSRLFIFFGVILLGLLFVGCSNNAISKIQKIDDANKYFDDFFNHDEIEKDESWTGIEVWIFCNYSKHEKYDEWVKNYNLKGSYSSSKEKYLDNYFDLLNTACYELIKDNFIYGKFTSICSGEFLYFTYSSQTNLDKDYPSIEALSKESYIVKVIIQETKTSLSGDE